MWKHKSDILTPLPKMTFKQAIWILINNCQKAFAHIKKTISSKKRETLLVYPKFRKAFKTHTYASKL